MPDKKSIVTDPIELKTAQEYFAAFENQGHLETFNQCIGGVFHADQMKSWSVIPDFEGIFFWYCLDKGQISLAAELRHGFKFKDEEIESYLPNLNSVFIESDNFIWNSGEKAWNPFKTVSEFECEVLLPSKPDLPTNSIKIELKVTEFLNHTRGKNLCEVGFAYMSDEDGRALGQSYLSTFLGQPKLEYISYHFGFESKDIPHGLRLVLIARDSNGMPLQEIDPSKNFKFFMLNGSRPPRPPQTLIN
jgi:hypothetical protein